MLVSPYIDVADDTLITPVGRESEAKEQQLSEK
jgi:hypothetical protein